MRRRSLIGGGLLAAVVCVLVAVAVWAARPDCCPCEREAAYAANTYNAMRAGLPRSWPRSPETGGLTFNMIRARGEAREAAREAMEAAWEAAWERWLDCLEANR